MGVIVREGGGKRGRGGGPREEGYSVSSGGWGWDILGFRFGGFWCIVRHPNLVCATAHQQPPASLTAVLMRAAWVSFSGFDAL